MVNYVLKAEPGKIKLAGVALLVNSRRYREAAAAIRSAPSTGFDPVPYFLLCQSLELILKAFFWLKSGQSPAQLKNRYGHNIEKLWNDAKSLGIAKYATVTPLRDKIIALVGPYYRKRKLNYLDLEMVFSGFGALKAEPQAIPTLLRLTSQLQKSLRSPVLAAS